MDIYLVVYDRNAFEVSTKLFSDIREYIDEIMVREQPRRAWQGEEHITKRMDETHFSQYIPDLYETAPCNTAPSASDQISPMSKSPKDRTQTIAEILMDMDKSFSETLLDLIDKSGMKDSEVYKKANVDRRLFSKIRSDMQYKPSKVTAVAFALALELDLYQTRDLLEKAGYSMTHSNKFDIIIEYFIMRKNYNVFEINEVLFAFDQSLIGV